MSTVMDTPKEMLARMDCMVRLMRMDCTTLDEEEKKKKMSVDVTWKEWRRGRAAVMEGCDATTTDSHDVAACPVKMALPCITILSSLLYLYSSGMQV